MSPLAVKVLNALPTPLIAGRSNNYQQLSGDRTKADKFDAKLDGQIRSTMSGFLRVSQSKRNQNQDSSFPGPSGGNGTVLWVLSQQATAAYTWISSPTSVLDLRFGVSRMYAGKKPPFLGQPNMLEAYGIPGLPSDPALAGGLLPISLQGLTGLGRQATIPQFQNPLSFDSKVNFNKIIGRHSMKFGYENVIIRTQVLDVNPMYGADQYLGGFSKPAGGAADPTTYSLADFMFGLGDSLAVPARVPGHRHASADLRAAHAAGPCARSDRGLAECRRWRCSRNRRRTGQRCAHCWPPDGLRARRCTMRGSRPCAGTMAYVSYGPRTGISAASPA